jgi:hypothetical protein
VPLIIAVWVIALLHILGAVVIFIVGRWLAGFGQRLIRRMLGRTQATPALIEKLKGRGIHILEQTMVSGGRRVCFFEGPDGVQLEFIEMK